MSISTRERFLDICHFKRPGDLWLADAFWSETLLEEWVKQGAPKQILSATTPAFETPFERRILGPGDPFANLGNRFLHDYFQFDYKYPEGVARQPWGVGFSINGPITTTALAVVPGYKPKIISEDEQTVTYINRRGQTLKTLKDHPDRMPTFLDWPVKDRATWNEYKKRLDPNTPERWPSDWNAYVQEMNKLGEEAPISLEVHGLYGDPRELLGSERILYMFYDDPNLIEDMMEQMLYLETEVIKRVVKDIRVDMAIFWEDMCYKAGPLISPDMVRKYMMPRYKKITDLLHSNGVDIIFMDCDGNVNELIPLWLEVGINYMWPLEISAGNDAVAIRKKYGKELIMGGTIDKLALLKGKAAIREEVMSKVPFLLEQGGYLPTTDHYVPLGVTFENYCYYINLMREVAGLEKLSF